MDKRAGPALLHGLIPLQRHTAAACNTGRVAPTAHGIGAPRRAAVATHVALRSLCNLRAHTRRALDVLQSGAARLERCLMSVRASPGELSPSAGHRPAPTTPSHRLAPTAHTTPQHQVIRAVFARRGEFGVFSHPHPTQVLRSRRVHGTSQQLHTSRMSPGTSARQTHPVSHASTRRACPPCLKPVLHRPAPQRATRAPARRSARGRATPRRQQEHPHDPDTRVRC